MQRTTLFFMLALMCIPGVSMRGQSSPIPPTSEQIVVSATKLPEQEIDLPADTTVITGAELRARGAQTLSDALATAKGVEAFDGSDQGSMLPNIALWGLKEFDAYLVELDGVPVGGTYDPDLQQIDVRNIDRIEIVRGPAGVVHGSTAFAGVISIYSADPNATHAEIAAGSFGNQEVRFSTGGANGDSHWAVKASGARNDGWRPRTSGHRDEVDLTWGSKNVVGGSLKLRVFGLDRGEAFGAPLPIDSDTGALPDGIDFKSNLALRDTRVGTRDFGLTSRFDRTLSSSVQLINVFGYTHRNRRLARTFVDKVDGDAVEGAGTDYSPRHNDLFEDVRLQWTVPKHRVLFGLSANYGSLTSAGRRFDLAYTLTGPLPSINDIADATPIRLTDRRLFAGLYAEDEWTLSSRLTATGGLRYDRDTEHRTFDSNDEGSRLSRRDGAVSGRAAIVYRILATPSAQLDAANVYLAANRTFKPAAFDPAPQEDEGLLAPERSRSIEAGLKVGGAGRRWDADLSVFDMHFTNTVVTANVQGNPTRINAGEIRFRGAELGAAVRAIENLTLRAGVAYHDPKFIRFTAVNEVGKEESADGHIPELVARRTWSMAAIYSPARSLGGSLTVRGVGKRALDRDNVYFTRPYAVVDASVYAPFGRARLEAVGRNLTNRRFLTTDSELQDGLRYVSAPRSFLGSVSWIF
ncbi:MAG: TonB-dependent receptor [Acidobacteriota bacterium]|nr:TonB-dependent receptor [Acidobacteriota bacterium]